MSVRAFSLERRCARPYLAVMRSKKPKKAAKPPVARYNGSRPRPDEALPPDTLQIMEETKARVMAMTPEELKGNRLKKRPPGRENIDPIDSM